MSDVIHSAAGRTPAGSLSDRNIRLLAAACGVAVANANYVQPLLVQIGRSLGIAASTTALIPALTQIGVALGVLFLLPLGDIVPARRLLTVTILPQIFVLAAMAAAPNGPILIALSPLVGFFGITPYILPPYASLRTPLARRGRVIALLGQGVLIGMLVARGVAGLVGHAFGWRVVYAGAAVLTTALLWGLRRGVANDATATRTRYIALSRGLVDVYRNNADIRWSALCQACATGSFAALWTGITFHMESAPFNWHGDGVGMLALVGAAAAFFAPFAGDLVDRSGPRRALLLALVVVLVAWVVLATFGTRLAGVIAGMILLDLGSAATDIANRTIIFSCRPEIRSRLATIYLSAKFLGGGLMAWLAGVAWSAGGWRLVCASGAAAAALAALVALARVGRTGAHAAMCRT
jgi:predicted MFS family arabinose efflux permease